MTKLAAKMRNRVASQSILKQIKYETRSGAAVCVERVLSDD